MYHSRGLKYHKKVGYESQQWGTISHHGVKSSQQGLIKLDRITVQVVVEAVIDKRT